MKKWFEKFAVCTKRLHTQLFLTYFFVFTLFFVAVSLMVSGSIRDLLINQIGSNRIAVLRQIGERAGIIKTSSTTLSNLYTHEIESHNFLESPMSEELQKEACAYLDSQKEIYDEIFGRIGLSYEVVFLGANEFVYNSGDSDTDTWMYEPWYKNYWLAYWKGKREKSSFPVRFPRRTKEKPSISLQQEDCWERVEKKAC